MRDGGDRPTHGCDHDAVVVGGGPAGCAAGLYTARYGLDTVIFDRGPASIHRCAFLENYPGFPGGIDVQTFVDLLHDHVNVAGCDRYEDMVERVERVDDGTGFVVRTQDGRVVTTRRVVAATRYDAEYLRPLVGTEPFERHEHDGETHERFDREYADGDGTTPIEGLYVASPSEAADRQAVVVAGRGARVGLALVAAARRERGYPADLATHYDWVRRDAERDEEWRDRDRWQALFEERLPEDHGLTDEGWRAVREQDIDRRLAAYRTAEEVEAAAERGYERLLDHVPDDLIVSRAREIDAQGPSAEAGE